MAVVLEVDSHKAGLVLVFHKKNPLFHRNRGKGFIIFLLLVPENLCYRKRWSLNNLCILGF